MTRRPQLGVMSACLILCWSGCRSDRKAAVEKPGPEESRSASDQRSATTSADETADPKHRSKPPDPWCERIVHSFDGAAESRRVGEVLATTPVVVIVEAELRQADCSGIGHVHSSYVPARDNPQGVVRAYGSVPIPRAQPPQSQYYLLGGSKTSARTVDLNQVCIPFQETVDVEVDWVLPIDDVERTAQRLRAGACPSVP